MPSKRLADVSITSFFPPSDKVRCIATKIDFLESMTGWQSAASRADARKWCVKLSEAQLEVVKRSRSRDEVVETSSVSPKQVTLVLAAAAAGKTSTMLALYKVLRARGHSKLRYVFFNKSAQVDAAKRVKDVCDDAPKDVKTMDALVLEGFQQYGGIDVKKRGPRRKFLNANEKPQCIRNMIVEWFREDLDEFLKVPGQTDETLQRRRDICAFWVYRTYQRWVQSQKAEDALNPGDVDAEGIQKMTYHKCKTDYYLSHFDKNEDGRRLPGTFPGTFYADTALKVWRRCAGEEHRFFTFECATKYLQLKRHRFDVDCMLVDEVQDLSACQTDLFIETQSQADVFAVGDVAQCLYGWRGADPTRIVDLAKRLGDRNFANIPLTDSYRFGDGIARLANHVLYIKRNSRQANTWIPYWLRGLGPATEVMQMSTTPRLEFPYTAVGRTNAALIREAIQVVTDFPDKRVHSTAIDKIQTTMATVNKLRHYYGRNIPFCHYGIRHKTWDEFMDYVGVHEINFSCEKSLLEEYSGNPDAFEQATRLISRIKCSTTSSAFDVLLITACKAKGLEWPRVKLLDDFCALSTYEAIDDEGGMRFRAETMDGLNSWYVAITRARTCILLPAKFRVLFEAKTKLEPGPGVWTDLERRGIVSLLRDMQDTLMC